MRVWIFASLLVPGVVAAQQDPPPTAPANLSRADEIRYARSAAPEEISKGAKIWVLDKGHYRVAEQGNGAIACMVLHSTATSFEPQCGDMEADQTVLAVERFRTEQRIAGKTTDGINTEVDDCLALRSWLCGVLVNVRRARIRSDWRVVEAPDVEPIADPAGGDDAIDLEHAIATLPDGARDVYVLHDVYGYTHREIAGLLGIVEGTSKSQLNRARSLLRMSLL